MKTKNFVQLIGYLGEDPEIHTTTSGHTLAHLRLATDRYHKKEDGTTTTKTTWHDIKAWNKIARILPDNFIKGSHVLIEGEIEYRTFLDHVGHKRYITEIKAFTILNLDR
ncbi:MAG: single-stranded DNA-binding protein [Chitinophagaceae bacterium]|nr:single-stranded DNA-binding protein [Chitinophagaceae bacterium]